MSLNDDISDLKSLTRQKLNLKLKKKQNMLKYKTQNNEHFISSSSIISQCFTKGLNFLFFLKHQRCQGCVKRHTQSTKSARVK